MERKLHRIPDQAVFGGVASGLAQYFQIDVVIIRVLLVVMLFLPLPPNFGWTGFLYIILWAVLPVGPAVSNSTTTSFDFTRSAFTSDKKRSDQSIMILGGALIFLGIYMLLDHLSFWHEIKRIFWPVATIALGAFLVLRQRDKRDENHTNANPTTPPSEPEPPVTPEPDPQPYRPFGPSDSTPPVNQPDSPKSGSDDDDMIIKVN